VPAYDHVFVIVMENQAYTSIIGNPAAPYVNNLLPSGGLAANYYGVTHPSLPNYLAMVGGSTFGITSDCTACWVSGRNIGDTLEAAGNSWKAYMEGFTGDCLDSPYPYVVKHNPFAYYGSSCPGQVVSFTHFAADMKGDVPRFVWITPGLCHDGHDCSTAIADQWLAQIVPQILATSAWQQNGLLLITWDEGDDSANHVLTMAIHPNPAARTSSQAYNHYSLLATIEDLLGVGRLGAAAGARTMQDLLSH